MITVRRANDRGRANFGWLESRHTFSFGNYYDPRHMGFRELRVINDDRVEPGRGFGTHPHQNMEIISYVLEGALEHRDSMGTGSVIHPGEVQLMSAGTGVTHSEFNASERERVHFLQIWIMPAKVGTPPRYEQRAFKPEDRQGRLQLLVSPEGVDGSLTIGQDARLYGALLGPGEAVEHVVPEGRHVWVHVARGRARVNGEERGAGDGVGLSDVAAVQFEGVKDAEVLLFDLR